MSKIKYGQVGTIHPHSAKIGVYRQSPEFEVVGVVEPDPKRRASAEQTDLYRGLPWLSLDQLLDAPDVQVIGIETAVGETLDVAEKCVAASKHIHIDKPPGKSLPQFKRVLDEAARKHLVVQAGYMYRYSPGVVLMREFLKKGWLGEPFEIHAVMSKQVDAANRRRFAANGGGSMFDLGSHLIDLVVGVLGTPEKVHAFSRHSSKVDDGLADNMLAVLEYPGATAAVRSSFNEVEGTARRHFTLCGSEGTFHIQPLDDPAARIALSVDRGRYKRGYQDVTFPTYVRYVDDVADLARMVRGEKDPEFSYDHDYVVQRTLLEASNMPLA